MSTKIVHCYHFTDEPVNPMLVPFREVKSDPWQDAIDRVFAGRCWRFHDPADDGSVQAAMADISTMSKKEHAGSRKRVTYRRK